MSTEGQADLQRVAETLASGGVAVVPTESSYALAARVAADDTSRAACARVAALKGRPSDKAFPVVCTLAQLARLTTDEWATRLARLVDAGVWPGPLTVTVPARDGLPREVIDAGRIAVRIPGHERLLDLCASVDAPLTATSANRSGQPPLIDPHSTRDAFRDLCFLDDGIAAGGLPSTIIAVSPASHALVVLREGAFPRGRLATVRDCLLGEVIRG